MTYNTTELSNKQFKKVCGLVYQISGIHLKDGKEALVRTRLMKRLRALKLNDFDTYLDFIQSKAGQGEIELMIDVMTTNQTSFFRETAHFNFLRKTVLPGIKKDKIRIWSAACSSGQEPFSIAMTLHDHFPDIHMKDARILGTDIAKSMLAIAQKGIYYKDHLRNVEEPMIRKHFDKIVQNNLVAYKVKDHAKYLVSLAWLNLLEDWPMRGPFDVIFCRNVMIYFDRLTQQKLVQRFWQLLESGGYLFVGHSEGLSAVSHKFNYVQPAVYRK